MGVLHVISFRHLPAMSIINHPSRHGSDALLVPEVPKMSVWALCFTSSGSNGGCRVVVVFFPHLFLKKYFFIRGLRQQKKFTQLTPKKFLVRKKCNLRHKKNAICGYFCNRATLSSICVLCRCCPYNGSSFQAKVRVSNIHATKPCM